MSLNSKYLKDTGLIQAYQSFLTLIMNSGPPKGDPFVEASKFFTNYEKKYKKQLSPETILNEPTIENKGRKERKKIMIETKARIYPSAPIITPNIFERQERTKPLIGSYKKEEIDYNYNDILDGHLVNPENSNLQVFQLTEIEKNDASLVVEENAEEVIEKVPFSPDDQQSEDPKNFE